MNRNRGFRFVVTALLILTLLSPGLYAWFYFIEGFSRETKIVEIKRGAGLFSIARELEEEGVIRKAWIFILPVLLGGVRETLKYGEYTFPPGESVHSVYAKIRDGEVSLRKATFPEGITLVQMAGILESSQIVSREEFLALAGDSEYSTKKLGVNVPSLEGFLFPDTYFFTRNYPAEKVIAVMLERFWQACATLGITRAETEIREIVTTASLIEKETAFSPERPLVSAVIRNRLEKGMRLEFDPTVIYALGNRFDGDIKKQDLSFSSPYNTYVVSGLPPGPIAAPGLDSIRAALEPADVDYLYFVSNGDGIHVFSSTYGDHLDAVKRLLEKGKQ